MRTGLRNVDRVLAAVGSFFHRHWQGAFRIRERLRFSEETLHLVLAGVVGVVGGLTNLAFNLCLQLMMTVTLRHTGDIVETARQLEEWRRVLIPPLGAIASGLVLFWGLRLVGNQGANNILEVVIAGDGRLRLRSALIKAISSVISISTGASIGREGLITQLSATLASKGGQVAGWQPYRLRLLVACGAASGLAAAYNAPVTGAVFAAQIVLGNFSMNFFGPLVFASVIASIISRTFFGIHPWYDVPRFDFTHLGQLPWFLVLGVLSGLLAALFLKMLRYSEEQFAELKIPIYGRMAIGALIVGILAIPFPEVWGNGFAAINEIIHVRLTLLFLLGVFAAKLIATLVSVGSGTVGGVMTPTLFLGASLGSAFGLFLHWANLTQLPPSVFALVGMGSVLAATVHAPLLAMIMIVEISLNYSVMPPLMLACAVSTIIARRFHSESIYTEPLRIKGLAAERENQQIGAATQKSVGDLMRERIEPLRDNTMLPDIAERFLISPNNFLPVVDDTQRFLGIVALQDLKPYLNAGQELKGIIASDVMRPPPVCLTPNQRLLDVLPILLASELRNVPVVNSLTEFRLVGAVVKAEALGFLSEAISVGSAVKP